MIKKIFLSVLLILVVLIITAKVIIETAGPEMPENIDEIIHEVMTQPVPNFHLGSPDTVHSEGRHIWFESIGNPRHETVLLVMGLSTEGIQWHNYIVKPLVDSGFHVIRFDHRDVGLSGWVENWSEENAYTLEDMTLDIAAIIRKNGKSKIHLVGMSMGGMLAQSYAIQNPGDLQTLTSIASSAYMFDPELPGLSPEIKFHMVRLELKYGRDTLDQIMRRLETVALLRNIEELPAEIARIDAQKVLFNLRGKQSTHPDAGKRHLEAIKRSGSRIEQLQNLGIPTLVIHGADDPLVLPEHGKKLRLLFHVQSL